jgi:2-oxoglutarate dehydrogenase E1 component
MNPWEQFTGANAGYVLELYERYQQNPLSVDEATRQAFAAGGPPPESTSTAAAAAAPSDGTSVRAGIAAYTLAESIRRFGHLAAHLDPIGFHQPVGDPSLDPAAHGLSADVLRQLPADIIGGPAARGAAHADEAIARLRTTYCSTTGHDFHHVFVPAEREWLREVVESGQFRPPHSAINARELLDRLTQVDSFERFLHRTFTGKTRFSVEGLDMMIPVLDEIINDAASAGVKHVMIAMAHRGRLNVLAHVMQKPYAQILAEFKEPLFSLEGRVDIGWMGDVKYHAGARVARNGAAPDTLILSMPPNPSHLEAVDPVLNGMARAALTDARQPGAPTYRKHEVLAILIHGDAAFPGQGIVAETLNLSRLQGYDVGGMIHIIANNQLGFTADPHESFSTSYTSGLARGFKIPITHVNADDPVACIEAARLAWAYRHRFGFDYLIDLVGYRRYGHNEGDEPAFTQPSLYSRVASHPTVREQYAASLVSQGIVTAAEAEAMVQKHFGAMERAYAELKPERDFIPDYPAIPDAGVAQRIVTGVSVDTLAALNTQLMQVPEGFTIHRKLERGRERRKGMFADAGERTIDWATAEELAYASILADGIPIRLTGEDVERGTFSHRHAALHDAVTGAKCIPLQRIPAAQASFDIHNSPLTENATIGFEFGYNIQEPGRLVLWEGQYGDFINGAQTILDEFVTSGRAKWGLAPSLVLLLPHGYEGQGPDHSSGRLERFLNAAADNNMRVANCTTAAQFFHLLRRQALLLHTDPLPLVVMTPKSLLRHPMTASTPRELAEGHFQRVIDDAAISSPAKVKRLVLCSGKVAVDLFSAEARKDNSSVAIVRVEQLYPFPADETTALLQKYSKLKDVCWVQEEPENMGAWEFVRPLLEQLIDGRWPLRYIGRVRNSSPSEGFATWHAANQRAIVDGVFDQKAESKTLDRVLSRQV